MRKKEKEEWVIMFFIFGICGIVNIGMYFLTFILLKSFIFSLIFAGGFSGLMGGYLHYKEFLKDTKKTR